MGEQWLVHWKGKPLEEATWEVAFMIQTQFPYIILEDKVGRQGWGNVSQDAKVQDPTVDQLSRGTKIWKRYSRRKG